MRKLLWERRCKKDVVGTFWERRYEKDIVRQLLWKKNVVRKTLWKERCEKNVVRKTLWEGRYEKDVMRKTLWERRYEEDVVRKTVRERRRFIFDGVSPSINLLIYKLRKCRIRSSTKTFFFKYSIFCVCKLVRYFQCKFQ